MRSSATETGWMLLAGLPADEENPERSAVAGASQDPQQATGILHQSAAPLQSPEQANGRISSAFAEHAQQYEAVTHTPTGFMLPASEGTVSPFLYAQPSPPHDGVVTATWQDVYGHAVPVAPWDPSAFPPTAVFPSSQPAYCFFQPTTVPMQVFAPITPQQQQQEPGLPAHYAAGPSLPAAPYYSLTPQRDAAPAEEADGGIRRSPNQKRTSTMSSVSEPEVPAKLPKLQEVPFQPQPQPEPTEHSHERNPSAGAPQGSGENGEPHVPLHAEQQQQPQEGSKPAEAVPPDWSPEPFDFAELLGLSPQRNGQAEDEGGAQENAREADTGDPGFQPTAVGSSSSSELYTLQEPRNAAPALPEEPLPEQSGSARSEGLTAASHSTEQSGGHSQCAIPAVSPAPANNTPPDTHLFYRLPVVQPGAITGRFSPARALFPCNRMASLGFAQLATARFLLSKPEITTEEAEVLVTDSEMLVGRIMQELETPVAPRKVSRAVEKLGRLFLYLDAVVSIIDVVGAPMDPDAWWPEVASRIFPETVYNTGPFARHLPIQPSALATRLSSALQILKTRARLSCEETVQLKRELLCNPHGVRDFKHKKWNSWREDDARSGNQTAP